MYQVTELTPRDVLMYLLEEEGDHRGWERQSLVDCASLLLAPLGSPSEFIGACTSGVVQELVSMVTKGILRVTPEGFLAMVVTRVTPKGTKKTGEGSRGDYWGSN